MVVFDELDEVTPDVPAVLTPLPKDAPRTRLTPFGPVPVYRRYRIVRLVSSAARPDDETRQKISVVEKRLVDEYAYDAHSAREALNYVTTLLAQE